MVGVPVVAVVGGAGVSDEASDQLLDGGLPIQRFLDGVFQLLGVSAGIVKPEKPKQTQ